MNTIPKIEDLSIIQNLSLNNLSDEIWMPIKGYEGKYEISNYSRVKSLKSYFYQKHRNGKIYKNYSPEKILKQQLRKRGYYGVGLYLDAKSKNHKIHRLVAEAFITKIKNKNHINHINGIKTDNRIENLEWCTNKENIQHSYDYLKRKSTKGVLNTANSKKVLQYDMQGNFVKEYSSVAEAVRQIGGNVSNIAKCCRGEIRHAYSYKWKYA